MSSNNENRETPTCGTSGTDPCSASDAHGTSLLAQLIFVFCSYAGVVGCSGRAPNGLTFELPGGH